MQSILLTYPSPLLIVIQQKHGIPQRTILKDAPGKTRRFIFWGFVIWCLAGLLYYGMHHYLMQADVEISIWIFAITILIVYNFLYLLTYSIPVVLIFAALLKVMEILFYKWTKDR